MCKLKGYTYILLYPTLDTGAYTMSFNEEIEKKKQEYSNLSKEELIERLAFLETAIDRLDPLVKYCIYNLYGWFRGVMMGKDYIEGIFLGARFKIEEFIIYRISDREQWGSDTVVHEEAVSRLPASRLTQWEIIKVREERKKAVQ